MKNHQLKDLLNTIAPLETQANWDNSGIQICFGPKDIQKVLVAMEITDAVIDEAIQEKADMIVTHHPLLMEGMKSIHYSDPTGRYVQRLIKNDIMVYSSHTPFDIAKGGNTDYLMKIMGVKGVKIVPGTDYFLKVGNLSKAVKLGDFVYMLSEKLHLDGLKFVGDADRMVKTVACCTGAGAGFVHDCYKIADVLVTGDVKHHDAQFALDAGLAVVDAGHWGTEQIFVPNMVKKLSKLTEGKVKVIPSKVNQDPFNFMV